MKRIMQYTIYTYDALKGYLYHNSYPTYSEAYEETERMYKFKQWQGVPMVIENTSFYADEDEGLE